MSLPKRCKRYHCICCNKVLEGENVENPLTISAVYGGLIFRATGNYGSTIFDPMPIGIEEILQVIICDDCVKRQAKRVVRLHNIKRETTADVGKFEPTNYGE